jgi:hypothetical protein
MKGRRRGMQAGRLYILSVLCTCRHLPVAGAGQERGPWLDALACVHPLHFASGLHKTGRLVSGTHGLAKQGSRISVSSICSKARRLRTKKYRQTVLYAACILVGQIVKSPNTEHYPVWNNRQRPVGDELHSRPAMRAIPNTKQRLNRRAASTEPIHLNKPAHFFLPTVPRNTTPPQPRTLHLSATTGGFCAANKPGARQSQSRARCLDLQPTPPQAHRSRAVLGQPALGLVVEPRCCCLCLRA